MGSDVGDGAGVSALAVLPSGDLIAGGGVTNAGSVVTPYLARYTGVPGVTLNPLPQSIAAGQTLALSASAPQALTGVSVRWQRDGAPITNGSGGASVPLPSPTDGTPTTLTITNAQPSDSGAYTAVFSNTCGSTVSTAAAVTVTPALPHCPADYNQNGGVDGADVEDFVVEWAASNPRADVNQDGGVDGSDVETFFVAWQAGGC